MYEVFVAKIITKSEDVQDKELKHTLKELANRLAESSILNGIKAKKDLEYIMSVEEAKDDSNPDGKEDTLQGDANVESDIKDDVPQIPPELNTERGLLVLQEAIENKLCDEHYHWKESKALLAYFAEVANDKLGLSNSMQDGEDKISWKPFEQLFHVKNLKDCRNNYKNKTGKLPNGSDIVDELFSSLPGS